MKDFRTYTNTGLITVCLLAVIWFAAGCDESGVPPVDTDKQALLAPTGGTLLWALNPEVVVEEPFVAAVRVSREALDPPSALVPARTAISNADVEEMLYASLSPGTGLPEVFAALLEELKGIVAAELSVDRSMVVVDYERSPATEDSEGYFNGSATLTVRGKSAGVRVLAHPEDSLERIRVIAHSPNCLKSGWLDKVGKGLLDRGVFAIVGRQQSTI